MAGPFLKSGSLCRGSCTGELPVKIRVATFMLSTVLQNPRLVRGGGKQVRLGTTCCWPLVISRDSAEKVAIPRCHLWIWWSGSAKLIAMNAYSNSGRCYSSMFWLQWPVLTVTVLRHVLIESFSLLPEASGMSKFHCLPGDFLCEQLPFKTVLWILGFSHVPSEHICLLVSWSS